MHSWVASRISGVWGTPGVHTGRVTGVFVAAQRRPEGLGVVFACPGCVHGGAGAGGTLVLLAIPGFGGADLFGWR